MQGPPLSHHMVWGLNSGCQAGLVTVPLTDEPSPLAMSAGDLSDAEVVPFRLSALSGVSMAIASRAPAVAA